MCEIGVAGSMPPMKAAALPAPSTAVAGESGAGFAAPPTKAGAPETSVAGAAGQGAAGAASLGGGMSGIGAVLQQLLDAVKALASAIGGISGGGPVQVPTQAPGKVPPAASGFAAPLDDFDQRIRAGLAASQDPAQRAEFEQLGRDVAKARVESAAAGQFDPVALLRIDVGIEKALLGGSDPKRAQYDALFAKLDGIAATAKTVGAYNPVDLQAVSHQLSLLSGRPSR